MTIDECMRMPKRVTSLLMNYYGNAYVDLFPYDPKSHDELSGIYILVRFPCVTVTNEMGNSVIIKEVYVKIPIDIQGRLRNYFTVTRSEYDANQYASGYMHSHATALNQSHPERFSAVCIGKGPIKNTMTSLMIKFNEPLWMLFAVELKKWLEVESIMGGPYKRLSSIGNGGRIYDYERNSDYRDYIEIVRYLAKKNFFHFRYSDGQYKIASSYADFIESLTKELPNFQKSNYAVLSGRLCDYGPVPDYSSKEGTELFIFKGNVVKLHMTGKGNYGRKLITASIANRIISAALDIINNKYGHENEIGKRYSYI